MKKLKIFKPSKNMVDLMYLNIANIIITKKGIYYNIFLGDNNSIFILYNLYVFLMGCKFPFNW